MSKTLIMPAEVVLVYKRHIFYMHWPQTTHSRVFTWFLVASHPRPMLDPLPLKIAKTLIMPAEAQINPKNCKNLQKLCKSLQKHCFLRFLSKTLIMPAGTTHWQNLLFRATNRCLCIDAGLGILFLLVAYPQTMYKHVFIPFLMGYYEKTVI